MGTTSHANRKHILNQEVAGRSQTVRNLWQSRLATRIGHDSCRNLLSLQVINFTVGKVIANSANSFGTVLIPSLAAALRARGDLREQRPMNSKIVGRVTGDCEVMGQNGLASTRSGDRVLGCRDASWCSSGCRVGGKYQFSACRFDPHGQATPRNQ